MKADCETEAVRNYSRWQQVAGSGEEKEPPTDIMDLICPGDCSNHGECVNGRLREGPLDTWRGWAMVVLCNEPILWLPT